ncbi:hypothetical protein M758_3G139300 [Ceratodon purpureus]|nr:hypothetical protein M758_3G139300 [Ceratodon purpureus]
MDLLHPTPPLRTRLIIANATTHEPGIDPVLLHSPGVGPSAVGLQNPLVDQSALFSSASVIAEAPTVWSLELKLVGVEASMIQ